MNDTLKAAAEAAGDKWVFECPKYSGYPEHLKTFLAGWTAAVEHLSKDVEWTEQMKEAVVKNNTQCGWPEDVDPKRVAISAAEFQFVEMRARVGLKQNLLDMAGRAVVASTEKIKALESERDELKAKIEELEQNQL